MDVAVLGLGKMGAGFARRLRDQGQEFVVWNRSAVTAEALAAEVGGGAIAVLGVGSVGASGVKRNSWAIITSLSAREP